jgi:phage terminase large subunit-like protein
VHLPPPETHDFIGGYVQRLLNFPAKPNDEGDATSQALNWRYAHVDKLKKLSQ